MKVGIILKAPFLDCVVEEQSVIFADAGYKYKEQIGNKNILAVVGDFDSLGLPPKDEKVLGLEVEKNFTDGERAIRFAVENGYNEISIYGGYGGKIEHILGNIALLKIAKNLGAKARIIEKDSITELIDNEGWYSVKKDATVSLIPYGESCCFSKSQGLYYPLDNITLTNADTRGISNKAIDNKIYIKFNNGLALLIYDR
jgi:thiamine pyrophosphokinase